MFTIYPAIDLRGGRVVRLRQGRADDEIVYSDDPVETARRWAGEGATWLHVVNLDGAFGEADRLNRAALEKILAAVALPVQFGGGMRDLEAMRRAFEMGVSCIVLGTIAVEEPKVVADAVKQFGADRVITAIEGRDGMLATRGWVAPSGIEMVAFGKQMRALGIARALVTDIARDGMLGGIDAQAMASFARETGLSVIAAGGVATLADIDNLLAVAGDGVEGVNVGQALYAGAFTLKQAIARVAHAQPPAREAGARKRRPRYCEG